MEAPRSQAGMGVLWAPLRPNSQNPDREEKEQGKAKGLTYGSCSASSDSAIPAPPAALAAGGHIGVLWGISLCRVQGQGYVHGPLVLLPSALLPCTHLRRIPGHCTC